MGSVAKSHHLGLLHWSRQEGWLRRRGAPNTRGPQREKPPGLTIQSPFAHWTSSFGHSVYRQTEKTSVHILHISFELCSVFFFYNSSTNRERNGGDGYTVGRDRERRISSVQWLINSVSRRCRCDQCNAPIWSHRGRCSSVWTQTPSGSAPSVQKVQTEPKNT